MCPCMKDDPILTIISTRNQMWEPTDTETNHLTSLEDLWMKDEWRKEKERKGKIEKTEKKREDKRSRERVSDCAIVWLFGLCVGGGAAVCRGCTEIVNLLNLPHRGYRREVRRSKKPCAAEWLYCNICFNYDLAFFIRQCCFSLLEKMHEGKKNKLEFLYNSAMRWVPCNWCTPSREGPVLFFT